MHKQHVVIRFCGDSGDGMQLTGTMFSSLSAILGNEISTLPDFPAEIRAPQGTLGGVSGFQVQLGAGIHTPGDKADVLVAMNAAALKVGALGSKFNVPGALWNEADSQFKRDAVILIDTDSLTAKDLEKALYKTDNPFTELGLPESVQIIPVALTQMTKESLKDMGLDNKTVLKSRNMFALGLVCWLFSRPIDQAVTFLESKFQKKPQLIAPNVKVLTDGFNYGHNLSLNIQTITIQKSDSLPSGQYTSIAGNKATAWGLIAAAEKCGKRLFLGSYPITPATDIMHELAARKDMGVMVVQAEDEIAGVCTAIGAAFAGDLAATSTSGPGLSLKGEAIGLAVMAELPLVVIDVQRGGPSTGLPTKTEQTDLMQALYGRNGECPAVVVAASTPANCYDMAFNAAKIALEHMTPVVLLTDGFIANGSEPWRIPSMADYPTICPPIVESVAEGEEFKPYARDEKMARGWAFPGKAGLEHRIGGLEKDSLRGTISHDAANHQLMTRTRAEKVARVADILPTPEVLGAADADLLVIGWGGTKGHLEAAVKDLQEQGKSIAHLHFNYLNPLPHNVEELLKGHKHIVVCELNEGQFAAYLRQNFQNYTFEQYNKTEGQPFTVVELKEKFNSLL